MTQRLHMPFIRQMMLCGYKNPEYLKYWGYPHYGIDLSSIQGKAGTDAHIYASGRGKVLACGRDNSLGYGAAVLYKECESRSGEMRDLTVRYMHLASATVRTGDTVDTGDILGVEGQEGTADYHLHMEFDLDTTPKYALWSPQVSAGHTFWKKGSDTTADPSLWLWKGDGQTIAEPTYNPQWLNPQDFEILDENKIQCLAEACKTAEQCARRLSETADFLRELWEKSRSDM